MTEGFGKIESNFIEDMLLGISRSKSILLTEVARSSIKGVGIKKASERLSRQLSKFNSTEFEKNRMDTVIEILPEHKLFIMDDSEIVKPSATKMEQLDFVRDGSDGGKLKLGYHMSEIVCVDKNRQPVSVHSELYSARELHFSSANTITQNAIKNAPPSGALTRVPHFLDIKVAKILYGIFCENSEVIKNVVKTCGKGLWVFDRGFDDGKLFGCMEKLKQKYIIRVKNNRNIFVGNEVHNIDKIARTLKGKFSFSINFQAGTRENLKASFKQVHLPSMITTPLNMVVVYGFSKDEGKPFYVLTNLPINNKEECIQVVRAYLFRWKIEEYFKFKKQCYGFEQMRVQSLRALKNLNVILTAVITFLAILGCSDLHRWIITLAQPVREKVIFEYYRLLAGLCTLIQNILLRPQKPPPKSDRHIPKQRDFFYMLRYRKNELGL